MVGRLFKAIELGELEEGERVKVQYLAVYVIDWRPAWGAPDVGFVKYDPDEEYAGLIGQLRGGLMPRTSVSVESLVMRRGEVVTLWCQRGVPSNPHSLQVEVRATESGKVEVFCDEELVIRPFSEWYPA